MLTFEKFTGINNVLPEHRLSGSDLIAATDVNIGITGEISRRRGYRVVAETCHKNLWQGSGFMLATEGSRLVAIWPNGQRYLIHAALGSERVWYCNWPDGRVSFSNGFQHGVTDGRVFAEWSIDAPASLGAADDAFGQLVPGSYRYYLTWVRQADLVEGPATASTPVQLLKGGLRLDNLPRREGFLLSVYLSGVDGEGAYLAGSCDGGAFEFSGSNESLLLPCRTLQAQAFPIGTITCFWRGRVITAVGNILWASRPLMPHLVDWSAFKTMPARVTALVPVEDGVYVGTDEDLVFLSGSTFEELIYMPKRMGPVALGSGISAPGHRIQIGDGTGSGPAMLCIADGVVVAGFSGGSVTRLTENRYRTAIASEVCAVFREVDGIPQYLVIEQ